MSRWIALALATITIAAPALAEDAPKDAPRRPWSDQAEVGIVATSGNSSGTNFSLGNAFKYAWTNAELTVDAKALRAESSTTNLSNPDGTVRVTETKTVTAENYLLGGKYRMTIRDALYWYAGASWYKDVFAGLDGRTLAGAGVGYTILKTARHELKAEGGADYTREVLLDDQGTHTFASAHGFMGYAFQFSQKGKLTEDLNVFDNLSDSADWRAVSMTALTAGLTDKLAVKVSYAVIYANRPKQKTVPPDPGPFPPAAPPGTPDATFVLDSTDTVFSAALVINF